MSSGVSPPLPITPSTYSCLQTGSQFQFESPKITGLKSSQGTSFPQQGDHRALTLEPQRCLRSRGDAQLIENPSQLISNGLLGKPQLGGDLLVEEAAGYHFQQPPFVLVEVRFQLLWIRCCREPRQNLPSDLGIEDAATRCTLITEPAMSEPTIVLSRYPSVPAAIPVRKLASSLEKVRNNAFVAGTSSFTFCARFRTLLSAVGRALPKPTP